MPIISKFYGGTISPLFFMNIQERINAFECLGKSLKQAVLSSEKKYTDDIFSIELLPLFQKAEMLNPWFTKEDLLFAFSSLAEMLDEKKLKKWISNYSIPDKNISKKIGIVMAGYVPMLGFHDMLCVLISGHHFLGKLSTKDEVLLQAISDILVKIEPRFENYISWTDNLMKNIDAIIVTGSDNTSRYFDYYFGKYPHIIRKNRNSIAILNGTETEQELQLLGDDIFMYFGLGCRNVSKIFIPQNYDITRVFPPLEKYAHIAQHNKYANNYLYQRTILLLNKISFFDNGFLIVTENPLSATPISVLHYEKYNDLENLKENINFDNEKIQCIVSRQGFFPGSVPFGRAQTPELWDYADGVDTLHF